MIRLFHSLRWRLQLWYGLLLLAVLGGFGVTAYQLERARQLRNIDAELNRRVSTLAAALRPMPRRDRGPVDGRPRPPGPPAGPREAPPFPDEPPDRFAPRGPVFRLPPEQAALFEGDATNAFYYVIWGRDRREFARSPRAPAGALPPRAITPAAAPVIRMRGPLREMLHATPPGERILVGRSIAPELAELRRVAWRLAGVGGVVLLCGLAGGWWLASRAIRPIDDISVTAAKIAAGDLSRRIGALETDSELGRLAGVLNSTFARLEAAFRQQGRFTADAAHELRTPVSVLLTQVQAALARERTAPEYRETLEACQRAAQRMRRLIESLLELARLDAGQEPLKRRRFDLAQTAADSLELVRPLAAERGLTLHQHTPPLECDGDPERLGQVFVNLLTNAIQYNRPGGEVRLQIAREADTARLTVADTGIGISAADLPHIFERFYRADTSRSAPAGRTGLGLAISQAIVQAHGGRIEVASELEKGTTVTVRLPLPAA